MRTESEKMSGFKLIIWLVLFQVQHQLSVPGRAQAVPSGCQPLGNGMQGCASAPGWAGAAHTQHRLQKQERVIQATC